jgi:hypothetical protein
LEITNSEPTSDQHLTHGSTDSQTARFDTLRVRCPKCLKLYMVQAKDIRDTRPRFECLDCHERFWISYPQCVGLEEVIGLRVDQWATPKSDPKAALEHCPKCHGDLKAGMEECPHCGIIPQKYLNLKTSSRFQGSERLGVLWRKIIDDYENNELHQELLKVSSMENNLAYASAQYAQILQLIPQDERATKMIRELAAIASIPLTPKASVRIESTKRANLNWMQYTAIVGAVLIALGFFFPVLKNLTGLGAVLLFIPLGAKLNLFKF